MRAKTMNRNLEYPVLIGPLPPKDGGGFLATAPELPGCMSDGDTPEEALANVKDAVDAWIEEARRLGRPVSDPLAPGQTLLHRRH